MNVTLFIEDMTCGGCVNRITKALHSLDSTITIETHIEDHLAQITYPDSLTEEDILKKVSAIGYTPELK